jgi:glycosyltransferase involved in cell wall biosynthesis
VSKVIARLIDRVKEAESASMTTKDREITESVVTFAIPTLNRARSLAYLLDSITKQNYSKYEIIVIDGNSTDDTEQVVRHYGARLISVDRSTSLSRARQVGFQSARGDIVAMFDSDVILPHRGWLGNAVRLFSVSKNVSTVWCLAVAGEGKILAKAYADVTWCFSLSEFLAGRFPAGGGGSLFRLQYVRQVGGIDVDMDYGEDFYLARKLKAAGFKVVLNPEPIVHVSHTTWHEILQKELRRNRSFARADVQTLTGYGEYELAARQLLNAIKSTLLGIALDADVSWLLVPLIMLMRGMARLLS